MPIGRCANWRSVCLTHPVVAQLSVSIVSHGHGAQVQALLSLLARPGVTPLARVWLTLNVPEPSLLTLTGQTWPFDLQLVTNATPQGFGANHNQAFAHEQAQSAPAVCFAVLNPDMLWSADPFPGMLAAALQPMAGCVYPLQVDPDGRVQDHRRTLPSPLALLRRHFARESLLPHHVSPDWVNAAFLIFPTSVYAALRGFDPAYFMYCEDVDICLRLQLAGYHLVEAPQARVVHHANRASRRDLRHTLWHVHSLCRLWLSVPYRHFRAQRPVVTIRG